MQVPFHRQRLDFTCGPACLIMAMRAHESSVDESLAHEVDIWREATIAAVPATTRLGLALAAHRRGFTARVLTNQPDLAFGKRIAERMPNFYTPDDLDTLWTDQRRRFADAGLVEEVRDFTVGDLDDGLDAGEVPLVLTSTIHFDPDEDIPHWVVIAGRDGDRYRILNPLDEAPAAVDVTRERLGAFVEFAGYREVVFVGPRASG